MRFAYSCHIFSRFIRMDETAERPADKRKKYFTKGDILQKLKDNDDVCEVVEDIISELCPFDVKSDEVEEELVEKLDKVSKALVARVYRIRQAAKERKFRRNPELLEEKGVSCSQYSVLQSQESEHLDSINDDPNYNVEESDQVEDEEEEKECQRGE